MHAELNWFDREKIVFFYSCICLTIHTIRIQEYFLKIFIENNNFLTVPSTLGLFDEKKNAIGKLDWKIFRLNVKI